MPEPKKKRPRGRPPGIPRARKWDEPTVLKTHRMTPKGHAWVLAHKQEIERLARQ